MTSVTCPFCSAERSTSYQITAHLLVDHNIQRGQNEIFRVMEQRDIIRNVENSLNNHHQQMMQELQRLRNVGSGNNSNEGTKKYLDVSMMIDGITQFEIFLFSRRSFSLHS